MKLKTKYTCSYLAIDTTVRKSLVDDIISKYPDFDSLNAHIRIVFLCISIDAFICKKLGYFIYEAFTLRKESVDTGTVN